MNPDWWEMSLWERTQVVIGFVLAAIFTLGIFAGGIMIIGLGADNLVRYHTDLDACRKNAPTAYEYHECR